MGRAITARLAHAGDAADVAGRLRPVGCFGEPNEIADAALWLVSSASSFTTGHALAVDGGMLAS